MKFCIFTKWGTISSMVDCQHSACFRDTCSPAYPLTINTCKKEANEHKICHQFLTIHLSKSIHVWPSAIFQWAALSSSISKLISNIDLASVVRYLSLLINSLYRLLSLNLLIYPYSITVERMNEYTDSGRHASKSEIPEREIISQI